MTTYLKDEDGIIHIQQFICPECGNKNDKTRGYEFFAKNLELQILGTQNLNLSIV